MTNQRRCALVTGGGRGLGRAMAIGLARAGVRVVIANHIAEDEADLRAQAAGQPWAEHILWQTADLRRADACEGVVRAAQAKFGPVDILVNNAGLTITTTVPDMYRRAAVPRFWEVAADSVQALYDTNCVVPHRLAALVAPGMCQRGWGRIINVTTMLATMERPGFTPYGPTKAALEMSSRVWATELDGTGVTVNVLNPGSGANTPGIAQEVRDASRLGTGPRLLEPEQMVPPLLWLISSDADAVNGWRFDATDWDASLAGTAAAIAARPRPAGFLLRDSEALPAQDNSRIERS